MDIHCWFCWKTLSPQVIPGNFQSKMLPSSNHWIAGVVNIYLIATPTYPWNIPQTHNHLFISGNPFIFIFWCIWWRYENSKIWNGTFLTATYLEKGRQIVGNSKAWIGSQRVTWKISQGYTPENHHGTLKLVVCRCFSFSKWAFSGSMLVFRAVSSEDHVCCTKMNPRCSQASTYFLSFCKVPQRVLLLMEGNPSPHGM